MFQGKQTGFHDKNEWKVILLYIIYINDHNFQFVNNNNNSFI